MGIDGLIERFWSELAVIREAPLSFLIGLAVVGTAIWFLLGWQYSTRISHRDDEISILNTTIQDYERKLEGASPDEAAAKISNLEARLAGLEPKLLSSKEMVDFTTALQTNAGTVNIVTDGSATLSKSLSRQIAHAFRSAGWEVSVGSVFGIQNPPLSGVAISTNQGERPPRITTVLKALESVGLKYDIRTLPALVSEDAVQILITDPTSY